MGANSQKLRRLIQDGLVQVPDVHDALSAVLAVDAGFESLYIGSFGFAASQYGLPDQSLISVDQLIAQTRLITDLIDVPILLDLEDGGGNAVTTYRNIEKAERAGAAAIQIEDHLPGKSYGRGGDLYSPSIAVDKIRAALDARSDALIIARTEALAVGLEIGEAMERVAQYADAGADLVTVTLLPMSDVSRLRVATGLPVAQFALSESREALAAAEVSVAIYAGHSAMVATAAITDWLRQLRNDGRSFAAQDAGVISQYSSIGELLGASCNAELAKRYGIIASQ